MNSAIPHRFEQHRRFAASVIVAVFVSACASPGGYENNDVTGSRVAAEFVNAPDAVPRDEPVAAASTRPYTVLGKRYYPLKQRQPVRQVGEASWYGKPFHGRPTSIGETYDMYAMTAAHPTLPLPSYVQITNQDNRRTVVVRVNDRGPFLKDQMIDLSFAAAAKLGYVEQGTAQVVMEVVDPVVVTLQKLRIRRGLPANATPARLAIASQSDAIALPLRAAAQLPLPTAQPPTTDASPVDNSQPAGSPATVPPIPVTAALKAPQQNPPAISAVSRPSADNLPTDKRLAKAVEPQKPEPAASELIESRQLSARKNRQIADVFIPPDVLPGRPAPPPVGPPPVILVEAIDGKALRRAVPERIRTKKAASTRPSNAKEPSSKPVFVVPFKDRLPQTAKKEEKPARFYLQLGAYETRRSARVALTQAEATLRWLNQPVAIISDRGRHKLQAGPFSTAKGAQRAARRIRSDSSFSPFYVFR